MVFLPINLDNVNNAAVLYVKIFGSEPWCMQWNYSSAYARLSAEVKSVGFDGFIVLGENGFPEGFLMGHSEVREDGKSEFILRELCFEANDNGVSAALAGLSHLSKILSARNINIINLFTKYTKEAEAFFIKLGFSKTDHIMSMQKNIDCC